MWSFTVFSFCSYVCRTRRLPGALTCSFGQQHKAVGFMFFVVVAFVDEDSIHDEIIPRYGHQTTSILIRHQWTDSERIEKSFAVIMILKCIQLKAGL